MAERKRIVVWSPNALADLDGIWDYYVQVAGHNTAEKIVREIYEVCVLLESHPLGGRTRNEIQQGLRSMISSPQVIFYRLKNDVPEIVRVLDGRQDIDEVFVDRSEN